MLRHVLGDEVFFAMLTAYRAAHEYDSVVTDDLIAVCEAVAGRELDGFFEQWLYHPGRPGYAYGWSVSGEGPYRVHLTVAQQQAPEYPTYTMPIDVRVHHADGSEDFVVVDSLRLQEFELTVAGAPTAVELDPDRWVLADFVAAPTAVAPEQPARPRVRLVTAPNPFNPRTEVSFTTYRPGKVSLRVFVAGGRHVRTLLARRLEPGEHAALWDGKDAAGRDVPSGVYLCRLVGPDGAGRARMTVVR
jgi:hypothetical protein